MECVLAHPDPQGFRRWVLLTRDAHGLYRQFGFHELERRVGLRPRRKRVVDSPAHSRVRRVNGLA